MRSAWLPKKAALEDDSAIEVPLPKTLPGIEGKKTESLTPAVSRTGARSAEGTNKRSLLVSA